MLAIPAILNQKAFLQAPPDYAWNERSSEFYSIDAQNHRLEQALDRLDSKAVFGIATALC